MRPATEVIAEFEALPAASFDAVLPPRRALILAPHPDDESLGCGGLIAEACRRGQSPIVVILTDGSASHPGSASYPPTRLARLREDEALRAMEILGLPVQHLFFFRYEDGKLPSHGPECQIIVAKLVKMAKDYECGAIIAPWQNDPHCDHEAAAEIAGRVAEKTQLPLFLYPVWGWLLAPDAEVTEEHRNGWQLDISQHLSLKRKAIAAHASQYGNLIEDSPDGFRLPADLLAIFDRPYEVLIAA